jgi:hypothetical protein
MHGMRCRRAVLILAGFLLSWTCVAFSSLVSGPASAVGAKTVRVDMVLSHHKVVAGTPINGTVTLTDTTSHPITVHACPSETFVWVGLKGNGYSFHRPDVVMCGLKGPRTVQLHPGANRIGVTVLTTYQMCVTGGPSPSKSIPVCRGNAPPLPAGRYVTSVFMVGVPHVRATVPQQVVSLTSG